MNNNLSAYHSELPFPPIKVKEKNLVYASLLMNGYAGFISEFTSLSQYFYHYLVNEEVDQEIANMLRNISTVETIHLDILGKIIKMLGGDPKYYAQDNYWTAEYITYGNNILEQLEADLQNELDAITNYKKTISQIQDPYIIGILERIILDEEVHVRLFEKAIEKVKESQKPKETLTDVVEEIFPSKK
ncbi:MAG: bacterioferritin [Mollicutes bacterium]|nr:bacterioferritin [Mollicutes bacterium]